jgi:hypothetical protein
MAKITIVIEDKPEGGVEVKSDPNFETMAKMDNSGHSLTSAHGYAIFALNCIRKAGSKKNSSIIAEIPKPRLLL